MVERFSLDPWWLVLGVAMEDRGMGEVERAKGETGGGGFHLGVVLLRRTGSFIDSALLGDEGSFGEGVPLELEKEWDVPSTGRAVPLLNRRNIDGFRLTRLDCLRRNFPIRLPNQGTLFRPSCLMLVWSSGIMCMVIGCLPFFLREPFFCFNIRLTTWT